MKFLLKHTKIRLKYNIIDNSFIIENSESFNYESIDRVSITFEKHRLVLHYSQESFEIKERDILEIIAKNAGVFVQHISFDNNAELIVSNDNNVYIIVADPVHGTNSLLTRNFILMRIDKENKSIAEVELIQSNVFCLKSLTS